MYLCLDEIKDKITNKVDKMKIIHVLWLCLDFVKNHPESKFEMGLFWVDHSHFMMNTFIFGSFINRKPNTINRNLRTHGFYFKKTTFEMRSMINESLPDSKHWILRWCDGFNQSTTENELLNLKYNEPVVKKSRTQQISIDVPLDKIENENVKENIIHFNNNSDIFDFDMNLSEPITNFNDFSTFSDKNISSFGLFDDFELNQQNDTDFLSFLE
ncbi:hypothetical protein M9Y10_015766 [Tritrichomonas musculus]|uniref:Initiator binding domain-containing protein n=1 Tax=Tritrichomonas musculus TaxID=1915356 RepID=A0ABR2I4M0_9EUKA